MLYYKLYEIGIQGKAREWIKSFLTQRAQTVRVENLTGTQAEVTSGVPQGTVLGPLLFFILINNISDDLSDPHTCVSLFADDTHVSRRVRVESDVETLQGQLNLIYKWQIKNNMSFNNDKFELIRTGKMNSDLHNNTIYFTSDYNDVIDQSNSVKDLGVFMDDDLAFKSQINKVIQKVKQKVSWCLRCFRSREINTIKTLWRSFILPDIDYCSILWFNPNKPQEVKELEQLQNRFMKSTKGQWESDYWSRLNTFKLLSIQRRIERFIIIYSWKSLENLVPDIGLSSHVHPHKGRLLRIPSIPRSTMSIKTLRDRTICVTGSKFLARPLPFGQMRSSTSWWIITYFPDNIWPNSFYLATLKQF